MSKSANLQSYLSHAHVHFSAALVHGPVAKFHISHCDHHVLFELSPERAFFCNEFEKHNHGFSRQIPVRSGIAGPAQMNGGYEDKVQHGIERMKNRNLLMGWMLSRKTVSALLSQEGAR